MKVNILIVGVGGQGTLLASRVLGEFASGRNLDCKLSEVHGMAQRGGSVVTHVKIADKVYSPIIAEGDADIILAFEELEALRARHCLKDKGMMIINSQQIFPMPVITGAASYPQGILQKIIGEGIKVESLDALEIASECGNIKAANTVMLGRMVKIMGIPLEELQGVLRRVIPERFIDVNIKAAQAGHEVSNDIQP